MHGLVFQGDRRVALTEFPDPAPGPGEVVVRVMASGMCGSDLHYYRAQSGDTSPESRCIGGHEPAGVVEALGPGVGNRRVRVGQRVMVHHYSGCGTCMNCRSGWTQMCSTMPATVYGKNAHGAHAPYMTVPAECALPLPDALSFCAGAAIGCGTGTGWGALDRLGDVGGLDLVVFGQGPVGLSTTMLAAARGARVIAVDLSTSRLDQASKFGAAETVDPNSVDPVEAIRELTAGAGAEAVVETSGSTTAATAALDSLANRGRLCAVGLGGTISFAVRAFLSRQITVMTSWSMSSVQQMACADFVARRNLSVDELFSHHWSLDQASAAYEEFDKQTAGKAAFVF